MHVISMAPSQDLFLFTLVGWQNAEACFRSTRIQTKTDKHPTHSGLLARKASCKMLTQRFMAPSMHTLKQASQV
jgi:hypothetical protein